jgi:hypothetical protein
MTNSIAIPIRRGATSEPRVSVTSPDKSRQLRIAFNPALVEKLDLTSFTHVALEHVEEKKHVRFFLLQSSMRDGVNAAKLLADGGSKREMKSRILLIAKTTLPFLPARAYEVHMLRNGAGFAIHYGDE